MNASTNDNSSTESENQKRGADEQTIAHHGKDRTHMSPASPTTAYNRADHGENPPGSPKRNNDDTNIIGSSSHQHDDQHDVDVRAHLRTTKVQTLLKEEDYSKVGENNSQSNPIATTQVGNDSISSHSQGDKNITDGKGESHGEESDNINNNQYQNIHALLLLQQASGMKRSSANDGGEAKDKSIGSHDEKKILANTPPNMENMENMENSNLVVEQKGTDTNFSPAEITIEQRNKILLALQQDKSAQELTAAMTHNDSDMISSQRPATASSFQQQQQQQLFQSGPQYLQNEPQSHSYPPPPPLDSMRPPLDIMTGPVTGPMKQLLQQQFQQYHNIDYEKGGGMSCVYRDLSIYPDPAPDNRRNRGGVTVPFPEKLHQMLEYVDKNDMNEIVSFFSHGRAFAIHKPVQFVSEIMPMFFKQSRFTSFQRQVNLYGFRRISQGPDSGGYYHELFLRGRPGLCINMKRTKVKGLAKGKQEPEQEPNFYKMPPITKNSDATEKMDRLLPSLAVNSTMPPPASSAIPKGLSIPLSNSLNTFGVSMQGSSSIGPDMSRQKNDAFIRSYNNPHYDSFTNTDDVGSGQTRHTSHILPPGVAPTSLDIAGKTNNGVWLANQKDYLSSLDQNANSFYGNRNLAGNPMQPGIYARGGSIDLNSAHAMAGNDFHNIQSNVSNITYGSKIPQMGNNAVSTFSNQTPSYMNQNMNQNMNLSQNLKNDNASASFLGGNNEGSLGFPSNTLAFNSSTSSGTFGIHNNPYHSVAPSTGSIHGMSASSTQGREQLSMSNFHTNFDAAVSLNQGISPSNALYGHQHAAFPARLETQGMNSTSFVRNAYLIGDMSSFNSGQNLTHSYEPNNLISNAHPISSNTAAPSSHGGINNSMMQNMTTHASNHLTNTDITNYNNANLHQMQYGRGSHTLAMHDGIISKNDSKSSDGQSFENPFEESDLSDGHKDLKKGDDQNNGVTKV